MTHTLHRMGSDELLSEDYVVLMMPSKNINHENSAPKLRRFFELALANQAVTIGDCRLGNQYHQGGVDKIMENVQDRAVIHAVFKTREELVRMLTALKKEDLGLSVVVSGLFSEVWECCRKLGLDVHSINQSLGRWGRTDLLPSEDVLEINTMCGHGMVTRGLIEQTIADVKAGKVTCEEGAERLFKPCMCGIFNTHQGASLLHKLAESK